MSLPAEIEPLILAKRGTHLQGVIASGAMSRLTDIVSEQLEDVEVDLRFSQAAFLPPTMSGHIRTRVMLECQRCGQLMEVAVEAHPELRIVMDDEGAKALTTEEEALIAGDGAVDLVKLVEDEILLNLPMIPRHAEGQCGIELPYEFD